jgi:succinate dehydrogenase / fumarate reductase, flavoprotein subunit
MAEYERHDFDVLVIGAGGAGLRAAIEASSKGATVGLVCKSLLGKAHTVMAEGGMAAPLANADDRDSWQIHFRDTMRGGKMLSDWRMAKILATEASERVRELEEWGAVFDRTASGGISQRNFGGHQYPRLAHVGDRTGLEMIRTLQDHGIHQGIEVFQECTITRLLKHDGRVNGAFGYWRRTGEFVVFGARTVIIATGGACRTWQINTNSWECTGDGHALSYLAGAELIDMEFVQFHPTGMVWPPSVRGILVTEAVRAEGGVLRNSDGVRFMFDNVPPVFAGEYAETEEESDRWLAGDKSARRSPELLTRDEVARAILRQVDAGKASPHGGVFLDVASQRTAADIQMRLPSMYHQFKELAKLDITKEPMEIGPTAHYIMGGVRVDPETQASSIAGLYACGEAAGGVHGANRLGGNSLTDLVVFGKRAGEYAAGEALAADVPPPDDAAIEAAAAEALLPFESAEGGENPFSLQDELRSMMDAKVGIIRTADNLNEGLAALADITTRARGSHVTGARPYNPAWHQALDLRNLLIVGEATGRSALTREESRGGHTRNDFAESDETGWGQRNVIVSRGQDGMEIATVDRDPMPDDLADIIKAAE